MDDALKQLREQYEPKEVKSITAEPQCFAARFSPCGKVLVAASYDGRVRRWDASGDELPELNALVGHGGWVTALAFAATGDMLYSADSWGQIRATSYLGEQPAAKWQVAAAHDGWVRDLAVSPDGARLVSCGIDKKVRLWSTADGTRQHEFATASGEAAQPRNGDHTGDVARLCFTADGKQLLTGDMRGVVKLWDTSNWQCVREFEAGALFKLDRLQDVGGVHALALDREQKLLAVAGVQPKNGGTVTGIPSVLVFDFATGQLKETLTFGQTNDCFASDAQFHPAGFLVVITCGTPGSGQLVFQRIADKEPFFATKKMVNCQSVSLHPDGKRLAVVATNAGSNGNGRPLTKDGKYDGNRSPINVWRMPAPSSTDAST